MRCGRWRIAARRFLAGAAAASTAISAAVSTAAAAGRAPPAGLDIPQLLGQLADDDPSVRVRAYRQLSDAGAGARPQLLAALIADLSDADPAVRSSAALRLAELGAAAQPALVAAAKEAPSLEVRLALATSMLQGPWTSPGDSLAIAQLMHGYGQLPIEARLGTVRQLSEISDPKAQGVLLRILQRDPAASVRWRAASFLRAELVDNPVPLSRLQMLVDAPTTAAAPAEAPVGPLQSANAPLLALMGWVCRASDPALADRLLRQAVGLDAAAPAALHGEMDFAFVRLVDRAMEAQDFSAAAALLRQQASHFAPEYQWEDDRGLTDPIARLFALHALHGPLDGYDADLRNYRTALLQPAVLYALAQLNQRQGQTALAAALQAAAAVAGGLSADTHAAVGSFLADQGWLAPAEFELRTALVLDGLAQVPGRAGDGVDESSSNIYFQLARVAGLANDELSVAQWLEHAVRSLHGRSVWRTSVLGESLPWTNADAWAEVHWHYLRAARSAGDVPAMREHLQQLLDLDKLNQVLKSDPGLATDVVPALAETGHPAEAQQCFDAAYAALHQSLVSRPDDPDARNDLAWLCARCGRHLGEAVQLADAAVAAAPDTSAYLDTDAEAHFQLGKFADAVRLESQALRLTPQDHFMQQQIQRFRAAASAAAASATQPVRP